MDRRYYSMAVEDRTAIIDIYGDITSWPWLESDVSAYNLSQRLAELADVDEIFVNINSYGGEVAEGLAIYNALRRHGAKVTTRCDGFACSIASVIFMAGTSRIMNSASLLMIHNAWTHASGNASELRKQADDLDTITSASKAAYLSAVGIGDDELSDLMDNETWITPEDALGMGFATEIADAQEAANVSQSARRAVFERIMAQTDPDDDPGNPDDPDDDPDSVREDTDGDPDEDESDGQEDDADGEGGQDADDEPDTDVDEPDEEYQASQAANLAALILAKKIEY